MDFITVLIYSKRTSVRILRHVLFWLADIASYLSVTSLSREITAAEVYAILLRITPIILTTYFIIYYLIPSFSKPNDKGRLVLLILAVLAFLGIGMRFYVYFVVNDLLDLPRTDEFVILDIRPIIGQIFASMSVVCMAVTIKLVKNKTELETTNLKLQDEKRQAELNFLKAQMQPHFLFNTLNTLYSETIKESAQGPQIVLHLSNLLRFMLDECNKPFIPVANEIRVIQDFIALEQMRHGSRLNVHLNIHDLDETAQISPLVFLPFVENSFKHTLLNQRGTVQIEIEIGMSGDTIYLIVQNDRIEEKINGKAPSKGIANISRQLELLYGREHSLNIEDGSEKFRVTLKIPARAV